MRTEREPIVLTALALVLFGATFAIRPTINRAYEHHRRTLDAAQIPKITVAKAISLGHTEWITDILWVNAAIYYGETLYAHLPAVYIQRYTETMIALDPHLRAVYAWGSTSMVLRTVAATEADIRLANQFLRRGLETFPDDPDLEFRLGANLAYELSPRIQDRPAEHHAVRVEAAEHLRRAAIAGAGPEYLPSAAAALLVEAGRTPEAVELLRDALIRTSRPALRERFGTILESLTRDAPDPAAQRIVEEMEVHHQRDYPYLPPTFYLFVGEPSLHLR